MAHTRAQNEASKIKSAMRLTPPEAQIKLDEVYRKLRAQHYKTAKKRYLEDCMLEKEYRLE